MALSLVIGVICGIIAAAIASSKGRNVAGWFFAGFFIGLIGIIIVACLPNLKAQRAAQEASERERRLLREQLRQERAKSETFRQHTSGRLDAHDRTLGVDTRSLGKALPAENPALALEAMSREAREPDPPSTIHVRPKAKPAGQARPAVWYYESGGVQRGPVTGSEIKRLLRAGEITLATLVWTEKLTDWIPAGRIPALRKVAGQ